MLVLVEIDCLLSWKTALYQVSLDQVVLIFEDSWVCKQSGESRVKLGGRNVEFKIGNVEQIPLPDASVDAVIGNMILHHCLNPDVAVKDMARVLVPGGRLALSDLQQHNFEFLRKEHADRWLGFEISRVRTIMDQAGFDDVKVEGLESCCSTTVEHGQVKIPMFLASGRKL